MSSPGAFPESFDPDTSLPLDPTAIQGATFDGEDPLRDPTVVTTTRRRPQVKLTSEKLLSARGLPHVAKHAPKHARISSRKSAYENLCHFLQFYQLWAHDLYPKAKFRDFVSLCDTLGRTDRPLREYRLQLLQAEMSGEPLPELDHSTVQAPSLFVDPDAEVASATPTPAQPSSPTLDTQPLPEAQLPSGPDNVDEDEMDALRELGW
ncbi:LAMI_0E05314g1_1 [Lachancea mirantina]|uniref:Chromosome segregation in meiosis protein n=1 Tax=Lachancea mirantina TaxID=1230905 RepID=A0A1G4JKZ1_9SACH|nr:LAMI_0E05314g1_1 [Lachancea mirantina]